jgi:hypothetical protein
MTPEEAAATVVKGNDRDTVRATLRSMKSHGVKTIPVGPASPSLDSFDALVATADPKNAPEPSMGKNAAAPIEAPSAVPATAGQPTTFPVTEPGA